MKYLAILSLAFFLISSCDKEPSKGSNDPSPEDVQKAQAFQNQWENKDFRLVRYYSPNPIDYIDTDAVVDAKTDLWEYVSPWLPDDYLSFSGDKAIIQQNEIKIPTDSDPSLQRNAKIGADRDGVYFNFVGHEYQELKYRVDTFTDTSFVLYAKWGKIDRVYSEFKLVTD